MGTKGRLQAYTASFPSRQRKTQQLRDRRETPAIQSLDSRPEGGAHGAKEKRGFPVRSAVKNPPAMQEMQVQSLGQEDPREQAIATHSRILAWEIPWMGSSQAPVQGVARVGHDLARNKREIYKKYPRTSLCAEPKKK